MRSQHSVRFSSMRSLLKHESGDKGGFSSAASGALLLSLLHRPISQKENSRENEHTTFQVCHKNAMNSKDKF